MHKREFAAFVYKCHYYAMVQVSAEETKPGAKVHTNQLDCITAFFEVGLRITAEPTIERLQPISAAANLHRSQSRGSHDMLRQPAKYSLLQQ